MPPINLRPKQDLEDLDFNVKATAPIYKWPSDKKLIMYHTNWSCYGRNFQVKDIPIDYISDINYAFYDLRQNSAGHYVPTSGDTWADFEQRFITAEKGLAPLDNWNTDEPYYGNFGQFKKLKDSGKKFNLGLSIGGYSWSGHFSESFRDEPSRQAFTNEVIVFLKKYPIFNRVDLDNEYISPEGQSYGLPTNTTHKDDPKNFGLFLKLMREKLNQNGMSHYEMSACTTADPKRMAILPISEMVKYLDTINIMSYDFADGSWGVPSSTHHTNVYKTDYAPFSVDTAVKEMIRLGVPPNKIVIGVAYYSRGFSNTDGLNKPSTGGSPDQSWEKGIVDYKDLPRPGATEMYDSKAGAAYSYDPVKKIMNSYDNPQSVKEKCDYIIKNNLKGIIVWEMSGDSKDPKRSLTKVIYDNLYKTTGTIPPPVTTPSIPAPVPVTPKPAPVPKPTPTPVPAPAVKPWLISTKYNVGDTVTFKNGIYICLNEHISQDAWNPEQAPSLWKKTGNALETPSKEPNGKCPYLEKQPIAGTKCPYLNKEIKSITVDIGNVTFNFK